MLGGLLAVLSSAMFAFSDASVRRGVLSGSVVQAMTISIPIGIAIFLFAGLVSGNLGPLAGFPPWSLVYLSLAGVSHFVWGRYCNYRAINAIGSNLAAPFQQANLLLTLALAIWLLREELTPLKILGIGLVVLGPILMMQAQRKGRLAAAARASAAGRGRFEPRYAEGYLFAVLTATGYGLSPIFVRAALEGMEPGAGIAGGLVSYVAATAAVAPLLLSGAARRDLGSVRPLAAKWFLISGVFVCLAQMVRYMALAVAPVTVVTPIMRIILVFRILFAWLINREHELFGVWVLVGIGLSLLGALALTLETEFVLSLVPLPESWQALARWRWPGG